MIVGIVLAATPGYSETFFRSKIKGLQSHGHQVVVFAQSVDSAYNLSPVKKAPKIYKNPFFMLVAMLWEFLKLMPFMKNAFRLIALERKHGKGVGEALKSCYLNAHILKQKLDWLHFGFATQTLGREFVAKAIGAKMAVSFRGFDINVYPLKYPNCYHFLWKHLDKVHSISDYLLKKSYTLGLSESTSYQIIPPAVAIENLPKLENPAASSTLKIITIARLHWIKGLDIAFNAMAILKEQGIDFQYIIIGEGEQKEMERYLYQVHELGLKDYVHFKGKLSHEETLKNLQEATIYLQSSLNEGFCNAVLEAQALGKLCIASDVGGLPENIEYGVTGWLFELGNSDSLAKRILEIHQLPHGKKIIVSQKAQERVCTLFAIDQQVKQFQKFYQFEEVS